LVSLLGGLLADKSSCLRSIASTLCLGLPLHTVDNLVTPLDREIKSVELDIDEDNEEEDEGYGETKLQIDLEEEVLLDLILDFYEFLPRDGVDNGISPDLGCAMQLLDLSNSSIESQIVMPSLWSFVVIH
jgi:hypothetical protein